MINNQFARKAIEKGADGLIAVAAGAGGHAGPQSPFALIGEIRSWFNGPLLLSGAIATGQALLAAQVMGADMGYIGTPFIATHEAHADQKYKQMIIDGSAQDIMTSSYFTGISGNYLAPSVIAAGLDPKDILNRTPQDMNFSQIQSSARVWKDIWGAGMGIGAVKSMMTVSDFISKIEQEYHTAIDTYLAQFS